MDRKLGFLKQKIAGNLLSFGGNSNLLYLLFFHQFFYWIFTPVKAARPLLRPAEPGLSDGKDDPGSSEHEERPPRPHYLEPRGQGGQDDRGQGSRRQIVHQADPLDPVPQQCRHPDTSVPRPLAREQVPQSPHWWYSQPKDNPVTARGREEFS